MSVAGYVRRALETAKQVGIQLECIENYHLHPKLIEALTIRWQEAFSQFNEDEKGKVRTIFSAHSLPVKILENNDPYPEQLLETSRAIAAAAGVKDWQFSWQSAGQTAIPWLGPDIQEVLRTIYHEDGIQYVIVSPIGFVSDHLEVLCDIDIEAKAVADELGMKLVRTRSLNSDPFYIETLATSVISKLDQRT
jgi:ferrochelatase